MNIVMAAELLLASPTKENFKRGTWRIKKCILDVYTEVQHVIWHKCGPVHDWEWEAALQIAGKKPIFVFSHTAAEMIAKKQ